MAGVLQHLRSSTLNKRPNPASMVDGQLAINYASGSPGAFFKDTNGNLVKVGPVHVGSSAPNVSPASGGTAGNSLGEQWLDTSGGTYVFKIWDGGAWRSEAGEFVNVTGDTMTGALGIIAGSASTPGLFFSGDANSGLYSPGADQLAISTGGSGRLFVDSIGRVGIGSSPAVTLDVTGQIRAYSTGATPYVSANNGTINNYLSATSTYGSVGTSSNHPLALLTNDTEHLRITSAGLVGVGTSAPSAQLSMGNSVAAQKILVYENLSGGTNSRYGFGIQANEFRQFYPSDSVLTFGTIAIGDGSTFSEKVRLDSSGRVGIGTSSPASTTQLEVAKNSSTAWAANTSDDLVRAYNSNIATNNSAAIYGAYCHYGDTTFAGARFGAVSTSAYSADFVVATRDVGTFKEWLRVTSAGRLGIGTTSPSVPLEVNGSVYSKLSTSADAALAAVNSFASVFLLQQSDKCQIYTGAGQPIVFTNNNTERARIDSSGRLLVGTSSAFDSSADARLQIASNNGAFVSLGTDDTTVVAGDNLGLLRFYSNGGSVWEEGARIEAEADLGHGSGDKPTRLVFSTTADGASSPTERMRITSTGAVTVGGTSTDPVGASASQVLACGPGASQGAINYYNSSSVCLKIGRGDDGALVTFFRNQPAVTQVGNISVTTTATAYNTSSDYRLKENVTAVTDGISRLKQLKPSRFNFIADPDNTVDGFLAHEVQTVVPEAISGEKDAVDDDGNPVYQGIDQSKLVPLLTAALQEAVAEIKALKDRVAALESA